MNLSSMVKMVQLLKYPFKQLNVMTVARHMSLQLQIQRLVKLRHSLSLMVKKVNQAKLEKTVEMVRMVSLQQLAQMATGSLQAKIQV